jgi:hypothetical protein
MTILETQLKLFKPERVTDFADGGGRMTGNEIQDGVVNALFDDVSQLDRTYGRVSIRKAYLSVAAANTDKYLGAHLILTNPPTDTDVGVTCFTTESWTDERAQARNYVESYVIQGPESRWVLYGDHIAGQGMVTLFSVANAPSAALGTGEDAPEIGDVILLSTEASGYTANQQFLRVTDLVSRNTLKFTDQTGDFWKDVVILEVGSTLDYLFDGAVPTRYAAHGSPTLVRNTSVADAARYFGVKKLETATLIGDLTLKVDSAYATLIPSAQAETALIDQVAGMGKTQMKQAGTAASLTASQALSGTVAPDYAATLYCGRGVLPGSLALTIGGVAYKDDGVGNLILNGAGTASYGGTVTYSSGAIRVTKTTSWSSVTVAATATPAVATYDNAVTTEIKVEINNRAYNYVTNVYPIPAPGTVTVDYMALEKWYRLTDNGLGQITGDQGTGSGTINYATGSIAVTLGALPDVGSSILVSAATPADYTHHVGSFTPPPVRIKTTLINVPVKPGTLAVTWNDGTARTATANAAGAISGDATGSIIYATGEVVLEPNTIAASGTVFQFNYDKNTQKTDVFSVTGDSNGVVTFTLTNLPVKPGSFKAVWQVTGAANWTYLEDANVAFQSAAQATTRRAYDDGAGGIKIDGVAVAGATINYATGAVTFDSTGTTSYKEFVGTENTSVADLWLGGSGRQQTTSEKPVYATSTIQQTLAANTTLTAHYTLDEAGTAYQDDVTPTAIRVDVLPDLAAAIVAESVKFAFGDKTYIDRAGTLYHTHSQSTDSATAAGTFDYTTGVATITNWGSGANTITLSGLVTTPGIAAVPAVFFRAPGAPLSTGQFPVRATTVSGAQITGTVDFNGTITGAWLRGDVDWQTGIARIEFGKLILDSTLPAAVKLAGWYNAANIVGGNIWVPLLVKPETVTYDTVLVSYIPLDGDILGVDTVRLPLDGRVPIYRPGDVIVAHNTNTDTLPNPVTAGYVHNTGRTRLSYVKVWDSAATPAAIPTSEWSANLDTGIVTFANPLNLAGYTQPIKVEHRIEDMRLVSDVQITGHLTVTKPVSFAFDNTDTYVSSALIIGDLQARVTGLFDQQTWTSVFSDTLIGGAATASFNDTIYPIAVTNQGAIQERWALVFSGSTSFSCYGEYSGLVAAGNTSTNFAPNNPNTGTPYFTLDALGWGAGWSSGNVLRFNTVAANYPVWLARTTQQSDPATFTDDFRLQIRGGAN